MTFTQLNLDNAIHKAIALCGYTQPTPIQARSIPDILLGKDVLAVAQTGTGKTAAFVLPALHKLNLNKSTRKPRVLVLTPTRELAKQIMEAARTYGKFMHFNIVSLVGGMPYHHQLRDLSRPVDLIVATPGRLLDHMKTKRVDLSDIQMLVLDEADRMLDMGFIDDVKEIAKATPNTRQTLLFSATANNGLTGVIRHLLKDPVQINLSNEKISPADIQQVLYLADNHQHKMRLLQHFMDNENIFKAIIFSGTKINCDRLANQLREQGYEASPLHGDLRQNVRNRTLDQLRHGKIQFLVATDVAARGIDVSDISHVINFDLPKFAEDYVHRIGRTGRAGKTGTAISLGLQSDSRHIQKIERYIGQRIKSATVEGLEPKGGGFKKAPPSGEKRKRFGKPSWQQKSRFSNKNNEGKFSSREKGNERPSSRGKSERFGRDDRESLSTRGEGRGKFNVRDEGNERPYPKNKRFARDDRESSSTRGEGRSKFKVRDEGNERSSSKNKRFARDDREFSSTRGEGRGKFNVRDEGNERSSSKNKRFARDDQSSSGFKDKKSFTHKKANEFNAPLWKNKKRKRRDD